MRRNLLIVICLITMAACVRAEEVIGLEAGAKAPDFTAMSYEGEEVQLSQVLKNGPAVLIFYRGGWCMYCNRQLQDLQQNVKAFKDRDATLIAISVDKQTKAGETVSEKSLDFQVISDPEANLLNLYNVVYQVPEDLSAMYKEKYGIDLQAASGRDDGIIAIPATYIIDTEGTIVFVHADKDYKVRQSTEEILKILDEQSSEE